jgi:hypothetical protein
MVVVMCDVFTEGGERVPPWTRVRSSAVAPWAQMRRTKKA